MHRLIDRQPRGALFEEAEKTQGLEPISKTMIRMSVKFAELGEPYRNRVDI